MAGEENMNGVNKKLEEILEMLKRQDAVLGRQDSALEELRDRMDRLEKNQEEIKKSQKALELSQDGILSSYHLYNEQFGLINQKCDLRCAQLQENMRLAAEIASKK